MASKIAKFKKNSYGEIQRGCSFMIPVEIKSDQDEPIDLTDYKAAFTVKKVKTDFDREDDFAYISKDIEIQAPKSGKFYVQLNSEDTDFEPGQFYFDIELVHNTNGMVWRLCTMDFTLDGGPSNRHVNPGIGQLPTGNTISVITLSEGKPIIIVAPTLSLDTEVYTQMATVLETMDALQTKVDSYEEVTALQAEAIAKLNQRVDELAAKIP